MSKRPKNLLKKLRVKEKKDDEEETSNAEVKKEQEDKENIYYVDSNDSSLIKYSSVEGVPSVTPLTTWTIK